LIVDVVMNNDDKFPKIEVGWCDGLGCNTDPAPCWCGELLCSKMQFQDKFDIAWDDSLDQCKIWEKNFRAEYKAMWEDIGC